jgi:lysophospholipase L1-like esterase
VPTQEKRALEAQTPKAPMPVAVRRIPFWASASVAINGLLMLSISLLYWKPALMGVPMPAPAIDAAVVEEAADATQLSDTAKNYKQLSYGEWLKLLEKEAKAVAVTAPDRLTVLLGDSLSLWFPAELLPGQRTWLNQGISGENSVGLLKRLNLLDELKPQTILVMVGVNDLIKGSSDEVVLENYKQILQALKQKHPKSEIVVQSLLPHGGDRLTVDDREAVANVANERIYKFNQKLSGLTSELEVSFLNLYPLFVDGDGLLTEAFSTDGLHLNQQGYQTWRSAIQMFDQLLLKQPEPKVAASPEPEAVKPEEVKPEAVKPAQP